MIRLIRQLLPPAWQRPDIWGVIHVLFRPAELREIELQAWAAKAWRDTRTTGQVLVLSVNLVRILGAGRFSMREATVEEGVDFVVLVSNDTTHVTPAMVAEAKAWLSKHKLLGKTYALALVSDVGMIYFDVRFFSDVYFG